MEPRTCSSRRFAVSACSLSGGAVLISCAQNPIKGLEGIVVMLAARQQSPNLGQGLCVLRVVFQDLLIALQGLTKIPPIKSGVGLLQGRGNRRLTLPPRNAPGDPHPLLPEGDGRAEEVADPPPHQKNDCCRNQEAKAMGHRRAARRSCPDRLRFAGRVWMALNPTLLLLK